MFLFQDEEGHLTSLQIIQDLMNKDGDLFLEHFARLGVFNKVLTLAGPSEEDTGCRGKEEKVRFLGLEYFFLPFCL